MAFNHLIYISSILLFEICSSHMDVEPKCSLFEFQAKILEKMVRIEHSSELLRTELANANDEIQRTKQELEELKVLQQDGKKMKAELASANDKIRKTKQELDELKAVKPGATYVRWGRTTCPGNGSAEVYSGQAGGSYYNHKGAAASMVCLPDDPIWKRYDDTTENGGLMYGAEYDDRYTSQRESNLIGRNHYEQDVPCIVCNVKGRSSTIMIPGRSECYPGWTLEYWGYLMSGHYDFNAATNYYCVDADQEAIYGRGKNDNGYLLYFVEGRCGSLHCPPYVNGRELTCVVCTK